MLWCFNSLRVVWSGDVKRATFTYLDCMRAGLHVKNIASQNIQGVPEVAHHLNLRFHT